MPLSYPLSREVFFDALPAASVTFDLGENVDLAATRGGEQLAAEAGERLWQGEVALGRLLRAETGRPEVLVDLIRQPGRSFMAYDRRRPAPLADPAGAVLGASTPTILALNGSDAREMRLAGLPSGYVLSAGTISASPTAVRPSGRRCTGSSIRRSRRTDRARPRSSR